MIPEAGESLPLGLSSSQVREEAHTHTWKAEGRKAGSDSNCNKPPNLSELQL